MTTKFYVDGGGAYLGGFSGVQPPAGAIEVPAAPEDARQVWDAQSGEWGTVPVELAAYAAEKRWEKENGGIDLAGMTIHTDDRSKSLIMGARMAAEADPDFTTDWKAADGSFVTIDAATIVAVSNAVLAHVASCFAIEAQVIAAIESETITSPAEVDTAFA